MLQVLLMKSEVSLRFILAMFSLFGGQVNINYLLYYTM